MQGAAEAEAVTGFGCAGAADTGLQPQQQLQPLSSRDEMYTRIAGTLVIAVRDDGAIKAPVITLHGERANLFGVLEGAMLPELAISGDKFWRLVRGLYTPALKSWRPRVNGVQLKALQNARLPNTPSEWAAVLSQLEAAAGYFRPGVTPAGVLSELHALAERTEEWWTERMKRPPERNEATAGAEAQAKRQALAGAQAPQVPKGAVQDSFLSLLISEQHAQQQGSSTPQQHNLPDATNRHPHVKPDVPLDLGALPIFPAGKSSVSNHAAVATATAAGATTASMATGAGAGTSGAAGLELEKRIVTVNVGGVRFPTTAATLAVAPGSYLWKLANSNAKSERPEWFVDRSGKLFDHVLEYLRMLHYGGAKADFWRELPTDEATLRGLLREALFFRLPGLVEQIQEALQHVAHSSSCKLIDSIYVESGYHDMGQGYVLLQEQAASLAKLNTLLARKQAEGWRIANVQNGVHHRVGESGQRLNNVYCLVQLQRTLPLQIPQ